MNNLLLSLCNIRLPFSTSVGIASGTKSILAYSANSSDVGGESGSTGRTITDGDGSSLGLGSRLIGGCQIVGCAAGAAGAGGGEGGGEGGVAGGGEGGGVAGGE